MRRNLDLIIGAAMIAEAAICFYPDWLKSHYDHAIPLCVAAIGIVALLWKWRADTQADKKRDAVERERDAVERERAKADQESQRLMRRMAEKQGIDISEKGDEKPPQISSGTPSSHDPRVLVTLRDNRRGGAWPSNLRTPLVVDNDGESMAKNVRVSEIPLHAKTIKFPSVIPVLRKGGNAEIDPDAGNDVGVLLRKDIIRPLLNEWNSRDSLEVKELTFPVTISYETHDGIPCETHCEMVFNPFIEIIQNKDGKHNPIHFRDFTFNRLAH
jgi:hypothetical protein